MPFPHDEREVAWFSPRGPRVLHAYCFLTVLYSRTFPASSFELDDDGLGEDAGEISRLFLSFREIHLAFSVLDLRGFGDSSTDSISTLPISTLQRMILVVLGKRVEQAFVVSSGFLVKGRGNECKLDYFFPLVGCGEKGCWAFHGPNVG